jgi:hypothetical protein
MSANPSANPANDARSDTPLNPVAASPTPTPAIVAVNAFGMRRVRMSITVAVKAPIARATNAGLEIVRNRRPENRVDRVSQRGHGTDCDDRDQRRQQPVLEQILSLLVAAKPQDDQSPQNGN